MVTVVCWCPYREKQLDVSLDDYLKYLESKEIKIEKKMEPIIGAVYNVTINNIQFTIFP